MSDTLLYKTYKVVGTSNHIEDFRIAKTNHAPPLFFKLKSTGQIFAALDREIVRTAVNLYDDAVIQKGEVHYSTQSKEWVLGSIALSEEAYQTLGAEFRRGTFTIQACPVTEKHDPAWGPVVP